MQVRSLGQDDPQEEGMATPSSHLSWSIQWTEEPGGPQFIGYKESDMTERLAQHMVTLCLTFWGNSQTVSQSRCTILYFHQQCTRVPTSSLPFDSYKTEVILPYNILTLMEFRASVAAQWYRTHLQCRKLWFNPWVRKIPQRRKWQPTPVFLPREPHGRKSLAGYSPWVAKSQTWLSD